MLAKILRATGSTSKFASGGTMLSGWMRQTRCLHGDTMRTARHATTERCATAEMTDVTLRQSLSEHERQRDEWIKTISPLKQKITDAETRIDGSRTRIAGHREMITKYTTIILEHMQSIQNSKQNIAAPLTDLKGDTENDARCINKLLTETEIDKAKVEIKEEEARIKDEEARIKDEEARIDKVKAEIKVEEAKNVGLNVVIGSVKTRVMYEKWTLDTFLEKGIRIDDATELSTSPIWEAFCQKLPTGVSEYLSKARHADLTKVSATGAARSRLILPHFRSDDDFRLWMANVAGSLIRNQKPTGPKPLQNGESKEEIEVLLSNAVAAMRSTERNRFAVKIFSLYGDRDVMFDLDTELTGLTLQQFASKEFLPGYSVISSGDPNGENPLKRAANFLTDNRLFVDEQEQLGLATPQRLLLLTGTSGSGKTLTGILTAGTDGVAIYTLARDYGSEDAWDGDRDVRNQKVTNAVTETIEKLVNTSKIYSTFDKNVVIVIDEAGNSPLLVRSLCCVHRAVCTALAPLLKVDETKMRVLVCGTGIERPDRSPGSFNEHFHVVNLSNKANETSFINGHVKALIEKKAPQLAAILTGNLSEENKEVLQLQRHSAVVKCQTLLRNRRMAAIFIRHLWSFMADQSTHTGSDAAQTEKMLIHWPSQLPPLMQNVMCEFRKMNGLGRFHATTVSALYSISLAICLGGPKQYRVVEDWVSKQPIALNADDELSSGQEVIETLFSTTGLLQDNRVVLKEKKHLIEPQIMEGSEQRHCGLKLKDFSNHGLRCYSMTPAVAEAGLLGFSIMTAAAPRNSGGFEHTIAKAAIVWQVASISEVEIDLSLPHGCSRALEVSKECSARHTTQGSLKAPPVPSEGCDPGTAVTHVLTPENALDIAVAFKFMEQLKWATDCRALRGKAETFVNEIHLVDKVTSVKAAWLAVLNHSVAAPPGAALRYVVMNGPDAPYGDVIVLSGLKGDAEPQRCLVIQVKHRLIDGEGIEDWEAAHEHYKNGIVDCETAAGHAIDVHRRVPVVAFEALFEAAKRGWDLRPKLCFSTLEAHYGGQSASSGRVSKKKQMRKDFLNLINPQQNIPLPNANEASVIVNCVTRTDEPPEELSYCESVLEGFGGAHTPTSFWPEERWDPTTKLTCKELKKSTQNGSRLGAGTTGSASTRPVQQPAATVALRSLVVCCVTEATPSRYRKAKDDRWHTVVLRESAMQMALRPVDLRESPFRHCTSQAPRSSFEQSFPFRFCRSWWPHAKPNAVQQTLVPVSESPLVKVCDNQTI